MQWLIDTMVDAMADWCNGWVIQWLIDAMVDAGSSLTGGAPYPARKSLISRENWLRNSMNNNVMAYQVPGRLLSKNSEKHKRAFQRYWVVPPVVMVDWCNGGCMIFIRQRRTEHILRLLITTMGGALYPAQNPDLKRTESAPRWITMSWLRYYRQTAKKTQWLLTFRR